MIIFHFIYYQNHAQLFINIDNFYSRKGGGGEGGFGTASSKGTPHRTRGDEQTCLCWSSSWLDLLGHVTWKCCEQQGKRGCREHEEAINFLLTSKQPSRPWLQTIHSICKTTRNRYLHRSGKSRFAFAVAKGAYGSFKL